VLPAPVFFIFLVFNDNAILIMNISFM